MSAVYFIRVGDYVKIGFSSNPHRRAKTLLNSGHLALPADLDLTATPQIVLLVPFCRMRDERNMQLLFVNHWAEGEWFHWSPAFLLQMQSMEFVTHAVRRKHLAEARRDLGIEAGAHAKEERWGMQTPELLAYLSAMRPAPDALARAS